MKSVPNAADLPSLTVSDVARLTGLGGSTVRRLADTGVIRCLRYPVSTGGKSVLRKFARKWVDEFIAAHASGPLLPAPAEPVVRATVFRRANHH